MDKKTINLIKSSLRATSIKWHVRNEVIKHHKVKVLVGSFKNGNPKYKVMYWCNICGEVKPELVEVDHIEEIGVFDIRFLSRYVRRLFCSRSNLQGLCKECHVTKGATWDSAIDDL